MDHNVGTQLGQAPQHQPTTWQPAQQPMPYRGPARTAHSGAYWLWVGWWWEPTKWSGRVTLWLLFWPLGLWRSIRHHQHKQEARLRRGYRR